MAGSIKGITIEFNGDTTKLGRALKEVNDKAKGVDKELRAVNKSLKFNPGNTELLGQKQTLLKQKIQQTKGQLEAFKKAQAELDSDPSVDKTSQQYMEVRRNIIEAESKLKRFNKELKKAAYANITELGNKFKEVGKKITAVGKGLTTYVTLPLAAIGVKAASSFAEVDKTMQLTNKTMQTTKEEAELLNDAMEDAAANSTFGMSDAANASLNFARAGLKAKEAADALAPAMNLAAGEGGDLDTVSAGLVATINGFGDSFDQTAKYADVFANACNNSALDVNSLSEAMSVASPIFASAGYNVQDASLYLGVMADNGIEASKAANSLKTGISRLLSPTKEASGWMDELGLSMTNADGTMKDTITVQRELHDAFANLSEAQQIQAASAIFGKNQMSPWLALIRTAPTDVESLNLKLAETGTTTEMAEAMMSGFGGSLEKLKSSLDVAVTALGEALAPIILTVTDKIQKLVDWFNSLSDGQKQLVVKIALVVAALGPVLIIIGQIATGIGAIMTLLPMLAGPVGIVIAIFAALVAIGVLLYKNWDKVKKKAGELKEGVVAKFKQLRDGVKKIFAAIKKAIIDPIVGAFKAVKEKIGAIFDWIKEKWEGFKEFFFGDGSIIGKVVGFFQGGGSNATAQSAGLNWYASGGIFNKPSVIGVGEAGTEVVAPLDTLKVMLSGMADSIVNGVNMGASMSSGSGDITIPIYLYPSGPKMGEETVKMYDTYKKRLG